VDIKSSPNKNRFRTGICVVENFIYSSPQRRMPNGVAKDNFYSAAK